MKKEKPILAERLTKKMKEHSISNSELAKMFYVSNSTVEAWKSGRNTPPDDRVRELSELFKVTPQWLRGETDIEAPSYNAEQLIAIFGLSNKALQTIHEAHSKSIIANKFGMYPGSIQNENKPFANKLITILDTLLKEELGNSIINELFNCLFTDNEIYARKTDEIYQNMKTNPELFKNNWTEERYTHIRLKDIERGQRISEIFLLEKINDLKNYLKQEK